MDENAYLDQLASLSGLHHYPRQGPWGLKSGCVTGSTGGYISVIGFSRSQRQAKLMMLLRFKKTDSPALLKAALEQSEALAKLKRGKLAAVGTDVVRWEWPYSFTKPKPEEVVQLLGVLRDTAKAVVPGFDGHCEECQRSAVSELSLMNGLPLYICPGCQEAIRQKVDREATDYEARQANYPNGLALGVVAAFAGGVAWGVVAYVLRHIFLFGAILIGYLVALAVLKGTGKVTRASQIVIPLLTVASILFGDAVFYTLAVMKEQDLPFSFPLLWNVVANLGGIERAGGGFASLLFGFIGAGYALYAARKPKFKAVFEPLGRPGV